MKDADVSIGRMKLADVGLAVSWADLEGWNPGLHDAQCFYSADPDGFFMASLNGEPAGCISAVAYDETFGVVGFYIVRQELRDHGIGMALWQAALAYLGNRTVGADGVVAMLEKYEQSEFRIAHYNARYEGVGVASSAPLADLCAVPLAALIRYDRRFFPAPRAAFLKNWISQSGSHSLAFMDGSRLAGYGVIRPCHRGFKIAPVFADTPEIAEALFSALSSFAEGQAVFIDIPCCNPMARELAERHHMAKVFETARIYRGVPPALPLDQIYGITSFELG